MNGMGTKGAGTVMAIIDHRALRRVVPGIILFSVTVWAAGVACHRERSVDAEITALKDGGHALGEFKIAEEAQGTLRAKACKAGTVDRVTALLCEYASADAAALGLLGAEAWVGQAVTGVVLRRDLFLLALADRDSADHNGKAIAKIRKTFQRVQQR